MSGARPGTAPLDLRTPPAWRLSIYDELPSTSDLCIGRARGGEPDGLAVLARRQTAGRGSHGRSWSSAAGNLALSVLLRPATPAAAAGQWSLMAGLAVADVLASYTDPGRSLKLKWPNDVLLDGAKLAGILIDTEAAADGSVEWMVIGIGANLAFAPDLPGRPTVCLASSGPAPPTEEVAALVLASLAGRRAALLTMGFEPIRLAWLARAHPLGTPLLVTLPGGQLEGAFAGLAPSGALLLETKQGRQTIAAGEVQPVRQQ